MSALIFTTVQVLVISFGMAVASISGHIAVKRKSRSAAYFAVFAGGCTLILVSAVISWVYEKDSGIIMATAPLAPRLLHATVLALGVLSIVFASTRFSHSVAGIRARGFSLILQLTELVVSAAFLLLIILMPEKTPLLNSLLFSLVIATLLHSTLFLVIFGSPGFDRHSRGLSLAALCLFVLFAAVYGTVFALSRGMPGLVSAYIFDVFFTTEMLIMLIITEKSFDHPLYLQDGNLSEYFLTTFDLSRRESEIIEKLLCEMDNKSIAYDLGLSVRTVENHLYSIYKKTGTASRGQLIRLLYSAGDPSLR